MHPCHQETLIIDSCLLSMETNRQLREILNFCIFDVNNMTATQRKELIIESFGNEQASSSEFDLYSIHYSWHGSLLYAAILNGDPSIVKMVLAHSLDFLEAVHVSSKETALDAAVRMLLFFLSFSVTRRSRSDGSESLSEKSH